MKKYNIGDRVETDFLGCGEIVRKITNTLDKSEIIAYMVKFDETPPEEYNLGNNPCLVFPETINN